MLLPNCRQNSKIIRRSGLSFGKIGLDRRKLRPRGVPSCHFRAKISVLLIFLEFQRLALLDFFMKVPHQNMDIPIRFHKFRKPIGMFLFLKSKRWMKKVVRKKRPPISAQMRTSSSFPRPVFRPPTCFHPQAEGRTALKSLFSVFLPSKPITHSLLFQRPSEDIR